ncbi:MAG: HAMP domain-containing histidine kinase, partial [Ignavibacteriales bacterium]|nr:HAMP domain-containing histidine kinase [Ignavibacteriales bacterium]
MKAKKNRILFISGLLLAAFFGLIGLQAYFLNIAVQQKEELFRRNVIHAMERVGQQMEAKDAEQKIYDVAMQMQPAKGGKRIIYQSFTDSILPPPDIKLKLQKQIGAISSTAPDPSGLSNYVVSYDDSATVNPAAKRKHTKSFVSVTTSGSKSHTFSYSGDSAMFIYTSVTDTNAAVTFLKKMPGLRTKMLVSNVVKQLTQDEPIPVAKRIKLSSLDSLLKQQMQNSGISIPFRFGLLTGIGNNLSVVSQNRDSVELAKSEFRVPVFSDIVLPVRSFITVYFPGKKSFILREMMPLYILSAALSLIILGSFMYVFRIIIKQQKLSVQVSGFINNMTHEFKTPISSITLASEALDKPGITADAVKHSRNNQIIKDEIGRMKQQVEKILQMAVLEEGDFKLNSEILNVIPVLQKTVRSFLLKAEALNGNIQMHLPDVPCLLLADELNIGNVFANIIDN